MMLKTYVIICSILILQLQYSFPLPQCGLTDFKYEYTPCDQNGLRWRVSVPKQPGLCTGGQAPPPEIGRNCSFACKPGEFLNVATQACEACPAGKYSLGGGIRFDHFEDNLPPGFHVTNEYLAEEDDLEDEVQASKCRNGTGWLVERGWLVYVPQSMCMSTLSYTVELTRPGSVTYTYRRPDKDNIMVTLGVQNDMCAKQGFQGSSGKGQSDSKGKTGGSWIKESRPIGAGHNVIKWHGVAFGLGSLTGGTDAFDPVLVDNIEIIGVAFTTTCSDCPPGTHSDEGKSECQSCPHNTFSGLAASKCTPCTNDKYSDEHASTCIPRPACSANDYFGKIGPCNNAKMRVKYEWIKPKICQESSEGSVSLHAVETRVCGSCNPGMSQAKGASQCESCKAQTFSDGSKKCSNCPPNTVPNYGHQLIKWDNLPPFMSTSCQVFSRASSSECKSDSWLAAGSKLHTAYSRTSDVILNLELKIEEGFSNPLLTGEPSAANPIGHVTFEFEVSCVTDQCALYFVEEPYEPSLTLLTSAELISQWNGTRAKQAYRCLPCPAGHSMRSDNHVCEKCPPNTVVNQSSLSTTCVKCGPNLKSVDGVTCALPPLINITLQDNKRTFNLSKNMEVHGVSIFTGEGDSYLHVFNVSLPIQPSPPNRPNMTSCTDNIMFAGRAVRNREKVISGFVCRTTSIPNNKKGQTPSFTNSILLSSRLLGISEKSELGDWKLGPKELASLPKDKKEFVHIFYGGKNSGLDQCPKGQGVVVTLVCDPSANGTRSELPSQCPDGTCDGCLYHIIVTSPGACPICTQGDYTQIRGECVLGIQTIHKIPAKHCILSGAISHTETRTCRVFGLPAQIAVAIATSFALLLCSTLILVCRKNKKLEYKYMKLVANSEGYGNPGDGELPAAESCALEEGEDEEEDSVCDRVIFARGKSKKGMLKNSRVTKEEKLAFAFHDNAPDD